MGGLPEAAHDDKWVKNVDRTIETLRLLLRPLRDADVNAILDPISDYDVSKHLARVPYPYHLSDAEEFLSWSKTLTHKSRFSAITLKGGADTLRGVISYEWSDDKQDAELGYWLAKPLWGQGLMTEAAIAMVNHAFTVGGVPKLISNHNVENPASGIVLRRAGFVETGRGTIYSRAQGKEMDVVRLEQYAQNQFLRR